MPDAVPTRRPAPRDALPSGPSNPKRRGRFVPRLRLGALAGKIAQGLTKGTRTWRMPPDLLSALRGRLPPDRMAKRPPAAPDLLELATFYGTPRGAEIATRLGRTLRRLGGVHGRGSLIAGLGYPGPYLRGWPQTRRIDASMVPIPTERIDPADLVIVVHALEFADDPRALLREAWKLLADHGRLLVVVPHRGGLLAHRATTPFGRGRTWSISGLDRLLAANLFRTETRRLALAVPGRLPKRLARALPRLSAIGDPLFGGVIVAVAVKDVYAGLPLQRQGLHPMLRPIARRVRQFARSLSA